MPTKYKTNTAFKVPVLDVPASGSYSRLFLPNKMSLYKDVSQDTNYPIYVPFYRYEPISDENPRGKPPQNRSWTNEDLKNDINEVERLFKDVHLFYHRTFGTQSSISVYDYLTAPTFGSPDADTNAYSARGYSVKMQDIRQQFYKIKSLEEDPDRQGWWILKGDFKDETDMVDRPRGYFVTLDTQKYLSAKRDYDDIKSFNTELIRLPDGDFSVQIDNSNGFVENVLQKDKRLYIALTRAGVSNTLNNNLDKELQQKLIETGEMGYSNPIFNLKFSDDQFRSPLFGQNRTLFKMYLNNGHKDPATESGRKIGYKLNCMLYSANQTFVVKSRPTYVKSAKATINSNTGIEFPIDITDISGSLLPQVEFYNAQIFTKQKTSDLFLTQEDLSSYNPADGSTNGFRTKGPQQVINKSLPLYLYGHLKGEPRLTLSESDILYWFPEFGDTPYREEMSFEFLYKVYLKKIGSQDLIDITLGMSINSYGANENLRETENLPNGLKFIINSGSVPDGVYEMILEFHRPTNISWSTIKLETKYLYNWQDGQHDFLYFFKLPKRLIFS